ncbi:acriflavine resistance protein B [Cupriavidus sp. SK-4]|uniref:efflux RND transporter permease subunit n=1 Tax=Cupriavidus sp. SK-4 TaxID=574750 RepID=UPI00044A3AAB|nr:efflux RND transporter permease subunit [Cupriavidus sp. SK-4]EYS85877.1 acriflavine resistance protein B [Cupriavidus sp. SK-4]
MKSSTSLYGWCIDHPIGTALLAAALVLLGAAAYFRLPVAPLPEAEVPTIQVNALLPGASPDTIASSVATPLEVQFSAIPGIAEMTSTSALGSVTIVLQFTLETRLDSAVQEVQAAINRATSRLPPDMPAMPTWRKVNPADSPVAILGITSDTLPLTEVSDYAERVLVRQLGQLPGVGLVNTTGLRRPAIRVQASPAALAGVGLTLADVRSAIRAASRNAPKGALYGEARVSTLETNGQLLEPDDYRELVVAWRNGGPVFLKDVARVAIGPEDAYVNGFPNGRPGVALAVMRQPGANIVQTFDRITEALPALRRALPADVRVEVLNDRTRTIRASLHEVELTLLIAVVLVIGVMALFLREWSATLIVTAVLGVSLAATCAAMYLMGFSLNNLTLVAVVVAVGFIVDDAIVVVENIHRYRESGLGLREAARRGVAEVGPTVVSIGLSLVAVFIPLLFMSGVVGRLFREFALTSAVAILISVVVSLTLAPALAGIAMRKAHHDTGARQADLSAWLVQRYAAGLRWCLRRQARVLVVFGLTVCASVAGFVLIPKGFFPLQDTAFVLGTSQAAADIPHADMVAKHRALADIIAADPAVLTVNHSVGMTGGSQTLANGRFWIVLKDRSDRDVSASGLIDRLRPRLAAVPGIQLYLRAAQDINIGAGQPRAQYQYVLKGNETAELYAWSQRLTSALQGEPLYRDLSSDLQLGANVIRMRIDRAAAARLGLTSADIDEALYSAFGQRQINEFQTDTNQYQVVLEVDDDGRGHIETLQSFRLRSPLSGEMVPLAAVVSIAPPGAGPVSILYHGMLPAVNLSFNLAPGAPLGDAVARLEQVRQRIGMPAAIQGTFLGSAQAFQEALAGQPWLILAALLAVYIILGVLYESLVHPLTILSTLPSAAIGALALLWLGGFDFSIMALIGVILLIGIVKKNGILLIDFALEAQRTRGVSAGQAIYEAALTRFRPIMMTTLAALLGAVPLMLGFGTGAELRQPLGVAVVGGLLLSQALTLFTTPVVYLALDRLSRYRRPLAAAPLGAATTK